MGLYSIRNGKDNLLFKIASTVHNFGFTPNVITAFGLVLGAMSGLMFSVKLLPVGLVLGFLSVFCDVLDGTIARKFLLETKFGLMFDSVADRISESAVVIGALLGGLIHPLGIFAVIGSVSLFSMRLISYRQGLKTDFAIFGRFERLVCILVGLIIPVVSVSTVCFVAGGGFGFISAFQIAFCLRQKK